MAIRFGFPRRMPWVTANGRSYKDVRFAYVEGAVDVGDNRLKKIVADLTLDREMLQDVIRRTPSVANAGHGPGARDHRNQVVPAVVGGGVKPFKPVGEEVLS